MTAMMLLVLICAMFICTAFLCATLVHLSQLMLKCFGALIHFTGRKEILDPAIAEQEAKEAQ